MVVELTEYEKVSDKKVLQTKKLSGLKLKSFDPVKGKWVETNVPNLEMASTSEEIMMDEKWMRDELVALRSTVNVALQTSNSAQADIAAVKQEMLQPGTGKRLWDGIASEKLLLQAQDAQDMVVMEERFREQQEQIDQLTDLVEKLLEQVQKLSKGGGEESELDKLLKKFNERTPAFSPTPGPNTVPVPMKPYTVDDGPWMQAPTITCDIRNVKTQFKEEKEE